RVDSPSLSTPADGLGPAFELKFLLDEPLARAVEDQVRGRLPLDTHADPALGGAYRTTTLYLDTAALDLFHRMPSFKRRKYRLHRPHAGGSGAADAGPPPARRAEPRLGRDARRGRAGLPAGPGHPRIQVPHGAAGAVQGTAGRVPAGAGPRVQVPALPGGVGP